MNTYHKFAPNVWVAQCAELHEKGETILLENKYGKENEHIVFNFLGQRGDHFYYSIIRADGLDAQDFARKRAERLESAQQNAEKKSNQYWEASRERHEFLRLGEPIKVGHHSERRHRALIERNHTRMDKAVELSDKAESYEGRIAYWEAKAATINLSMPESLGYYEFRLEKAKARHEGLKNGTIPKEHSYSLTYAKKEVNETTKLFELAKKLWG